MDYNVESVGDTMQHDLLVCDFLHLHIAKKKTLNGRSH